MAAINPDDRRPGIAGRPGIELGGLTAAVNSDRVGCPGPMGNWDLVRFLAAMLLVTRPCPTGLLRRGSLDLVQVGVWSLTSNARQAAAEPDGRRHVPGWWSVVAGEGRGR